MWPDDQLSEQHAMLANTDSYLTMADHVTVNQCIVRFDQHQHHVYLTDTLQPVAGIPGRQRLQSSSTSALAVPPTRLATVGDRAFPVVAARIWNNLPAEVTSSTSLPTFKSKLKSHLFSASFP